MVAVVVEVDAANVVADAERQPARVERRRGGARGGERVADHGGVVTEPRNPVAHSLELHQMEVGVIHVALAGVVLDGRLGEADQGGRLGRRVSEAVLTGRERSPSAAGISAARRAQAIGEQGQRVLDVLPEGVEVRVAAHLVEEREEVRAQRDEEAVGVLDEVERRAAGKDQGGAGRCREARILGVRDAVLVGVLARRWEAQLPLDHRIEPPRSELIGGEEPPARRVRELRGDVGVPRSFGFAGPQPFCATKRFASLAR